MGISIDKAMKLKRVMDIRGTAGRNIRAYGNGDPVTGQDGGNVLGIVWVFDDGKSGGVKRGRASISEKSVEAAEEIMGFAITFRLLLLRTL